MAEPATFRREVHHGRVVACHPDRPADIQAMFASAVRRAPDRVALVDGEQRWTYAALAGRAAACAGRLVALGLTAGDRLGILLDNRADYVAILLAAARLGIICVPMNVRQSPAETAYVLADSGAVALIHEGRLADRLPPQADAPSVRHWLAIENEAEHWQAAPATGTDIPERAAVAEDEPFCILYTSGTTGRPKGAILTHFGIVSSCVGSANHLELRDGTATVLAVPASHVTGILLVLLLSIHVAGKVVIQREFKAHAFLEMAEREAIEFTILVPAMYALCLLDPAFPDFALQHWRVGAYGGAPIAESTVAGLARTLPQLTLVNIYGATETTSPAVMMPLGQGRTRPEKVGRALPYADIRVMDAQGRECPPGEQGEIWISGPMVVPGYWNNPRANAAEFVGGYWKSGDIGTIDADGYIQVLDRLKDMINRGGFKIYSVEVENTLMAHDAVIEAAVVGRPCPVLGERVEAFVVVTAAVADEDLRAFCGSQLSDYKVPERIRIVPGPLPRNANGKLVKASLRQLVASDGGCP